MPKAKYVVVRKYDAAGLKVHQFKYFNQDILSFADNIPAGTVYETTFSASCAMTRIKRLKETDPQGFGGIYQVETIFII